ncbi:MAG: hypothetical protein JWM14_642 [Chitinophagaceae bacterium]|nr:hypothetical protein [Chitinophagaceae bacterium]
MQEKDLFEYAVIRVVPRVEREEFINVGVILYCARQNFLLAKIKLDEDRLKAFCVEIDIESLRKNLNALEQISKGSAEGGPIGKLDAASRFRWLTATRSTVVQASKVHPGFCNDAKETLEKLYIELVL